MEIAHCASGSFDSVRSSTFCFLQLEQQGVEEELVLEKADYLALYEEQYLSLFLDRSADHPVAL